MSSHISLEPCAYRAVLRTCCCCSYKGLFITLFALSNSVTLQAPLVGTMSLYTTLADAATSTLISPAAIPLSAERISVFVQGMINTPVLRHAPGEDLHQPPSVDERPELLY